MFVIKMNNAKLWRDLTNTLSTLIDEAIFNINPKGILLRQMDPSHVAMIDFEWPSTVFDGYECEKELKLSVNITEMLKLLRRVSSDESIELSIDKDSGRLNINLKGKHTRTFKMPTLQPIGEEIPTPKVTFKAKIRMTTSSLKDAIEDASIVSDHVRFEATTENLLLKGDGIMGSVSVEIGRESDSVLNFEISEVSKAMFSLNYLSDIVKAASAVSEIVTIEFSTDMPVKLDFEMQQEGKLQYYLAPRIEN
jgi:proliferating cell nuclear antigen